MSQYYQPTLDAPGMPRRYYVRESEYKLADMPERLRPDAEADRLGFENVSDDALVALILSGTRKYNPVDVARGLLRHFRTLAGIRETPTAELATVDGMTEKQARRLLAALELGKRQQEEKHPPQYRIRIPEDAARRLRPLTKAAAQETFYVILLDPKNRIIGEPIAISKGLLDASLVHPREVYREAIRRNAAAVVLAHNHPSGDPSPSAEDIRITKQLIMAGKTVDIRCLDHVIMGADTGRGPDFLSLRESKVVSFD